MNKDKKEKTGIILPPLRYFCEFGNLHTKICGCAMQYIVYPCDFKRKINELYWKWRTIYSSDITPEMRNTAIKECGWSLIF